MDWATATLADLERILTEGRGQLTATEGQLIYAAQLLLARRLGRMENSVSPIVRKAAERALAEIDL